ncbi:MAG TPA: hypothetical protein VK780_00385 [Thermoanaerobaculia bacterium]|jgi:hypothetical protein|nr:hypothetical protein [Thermoanaerobaculia bacterium]
MRYRRLGAWLLATAAGLAVVGRSASTCVSCCPEPSGGGPAISSLACCGEGCGQRLAAGQERPCMTSSRSDAGKSPVLPVTIVAVRAMSPMFFEPSPRHSLWPPASPRSGTRPLRL